MLLTINMTGEDFGRLVNMASAWSTRRYGKFEYIDGEDPAVHSELPVAYWVGESWLTVMFCREFIQAAGHKYAIMWDQAGPDDECEGDYVILTDYEIPGMRERMEG